MLTRVSMKLTLVAEGSYFRSVVERTGKVPLKILAKNRPMATAKAVVQR